MMLFLPPCLLLLLIRAAAGASGQRMGTCLGKQAIWQPYSQMKAGADVGLCVKNLQFRFLNKGENIQTTVY